MGGCLICGDTDRESTQISCSKQQNSNNQANPKPFKPGIGWYHKHQPICKLQVISIFNKFLTEIDTNHRTWKGKIQVIQSCQDGFLQRCSYSRQNEFSFQSINEAYQKIFNNKLDQAKIQMLQAPYIHSCNFFRDHRTLIINIQYFLRALQFVIVNGYQDVSQDYEKRKKFFINKEVFLVEMIEKMIELCKDPTKRRSFRLSNQEETGSNLITEPQDLLENIAKQEKQISMLLKDIQKLSSENARLQELARSLPDPNLITSLKMQLKDKDKQIHEYEMSLADKQRMLASQASPGLDCLRPSLQAGLQSKGSCINRTPETQFNSTLSSQAAFNDFNRQLQAKDLQITQLNSKLSQVLQTNSHQLAEIKAKLQQQLQAKTLQIAQLKAKLQCQGIELDKLNLKIKEAQSSQKDYTQLTVLLKQANFRLDEKILAVEDLEELNKELARQLEELRSSARLRSKSIVNHKTLFIGDILERKKEEKRFLIGSIENHMLSVINKTKLLYEFKRDMSTNFHKMIDNHSNLVVIVETANNALLAGYYSGTYAENMSLDEEALVISLTNSKSYYLNNLKNQPKKDKKDKRAIHGMVYDKYFFIIGNSQIRLRQGERKIYSNFGVQNGFFFSNGDTVHTLLCQGKKNEVDIINYEIHEIFFDSEYEVARC